MRLLHANPVGPAGVIGQEREHKVPDSRLPIPIPPSELPQFRILVNTDRRVLSKVADALAELQPTLDIEALTNAVAERVSLAGKDLESIIGLLSRLAFIQSRFGFGTESFLEALTGSLKELPEDKWAEPDQKGWEQMQEQLAALLNPANALGCGAKAGELLLEQQLVFHKARIITDLRPVFDQEAQAIQAYLPFHTLVISYFESVEVREVHIAMDSSDVIMLMRQLERAKQKEQVLKEQLNGKQLQVINTRSEPIT